MATGHNIHKMCVEILTESDQATFNQYRKKANSMEHYGLLRQSEFAKKLWPTNRDISYGFKGDSKLIQRTPLSYFQNKYRVNGDEIKIDPMQYVLEHDLAQLSIEDCIRKIITEIIQPVIGITLVWVQDYESANIRINFDPDNGSYSLVGTDSANEMNKPSMNFAWFDVPTVLHQFCHALGMVHQHSISDNSVNTEQSLVNNTSGISWNVKAIYEWAKKTHNWGELLANKNIINRYIQKDHKSSDESIMLFYYPQEFVESNNKAVQMNARLSLDDIKWLNHMYPVTYKKQDGTYRVIEDVPTNFYKGYYKENPKQANKSSTLKNIIISILIGVSVLAIGALVYMCYQKYTSLENYASSGKENKFSFITSSHNDGNNYSPVSSLSDVTSLSSGSSGSSGNSVNSGSSGNSVNSGSSGSSGSSRI
jgi:hypothetical protein